MGCLVSRHRERLPHSGSRLPQPRPGHRIPRLALGRPREGSSNPRPSPGISIRRLGNQRCHQPHQAPSILRLDSRHHWQEEGYLAFQYRPNCTLLRLVTSEGTQDWVQHPNVLLVRHLQAL
jgi:hypothetical protein